MQYGGKRPHEPAWGIKVMVGQFTHADHDIHGRLIWVDEAERRNFDRSKYIPGNGPDHRLGRKA